jgi:hypothetical protein
MESAETQQAPSDQETAQEESSLRLNEGVMECPVCGHEMPDLKGGKATICPACGFKDSCCY